MPRWPWIAVLGIMIVRPALAQPRLAPLPGTPRGTAADTLHGRVVADPYRWLERLDLPRVRTWASVQTRRTQTLLESEPRYRRFLERMHRHAQVWGDDGGSQPWRMVGAVSLRLAPAKDGPARQVLESRDRSGAGYVLVDPMRGRTPPRPRTSSPVVSITAMYPAPDGRHVALKFSPDGSEWSTVRLLRLRDGQLLPDSVDGLLWGAPVWTQNGEGFYYAHHERPSRDERVAVADASVRYHQTGTSIADRVVKDTPGRDPEQMFEVAMHDRGRLLVITQGTGAAWAGLSWLNARLSVTDLHDTTAAGRSAQPVVIGDGTAGYRVVHAEGRELIVLTDHGAPRKRLVRISLDAPDIAHWQTIVAESAHTIARVQRVGKNFAIVYLVDAQHQVRVVNGNGAVVREIPLPPLMQVEALYAGDDPQDVIIETTSYLQPPWVQAWNLGTGVSRTIDRVAPTVDTTAFEARQVWFASRDGTRVPMFVVHRRGLSRDGSHPALLEVYGGSGDVIMPGWNPAILAWIESGGVYAWASVRGGGEFGHDWYASATRANMTRRIDDVVGAVEHLVKEGLTRPGSLGLRGRSNGGKLVAQAITARPDLFGAAIPEVPGIDLLRWDYGRHRDQVGTISRADHFEFLRSLSPLHRVAKGTCYPATLVATALNDERMHAWNALKFTAALQWAQSCERPVLLRAPRVGGHAMFVTRQQVFRDEAAVLSFLAWQLRGVWQLTRQESP